MIVQLQTKDLIGNICVEGNFPSLTQAISYGRANFIQNEWRVIGIFELNEEMVFKELYSYTPNFSQQLEDEYDRIQANNLRGRANISQLRARTIDEILMSCGFLFENLQKPKINWKKEGF